MQLVSAAGMQLHVQGECHGEPHDPSCGIVGSKCLSPVLFLVLG